MESEAMPMDYKDEFLREVNDTFVARVEEQSIRPGVEVWPGEDDDAEWVASHERRTQAVVCNTPEYKDTPFCGTGYH
jgi:hypothetical protein